MDFDIRASSILSAMRMHEEGGGRTREGFERT